MKASVNSILLLLVVLLGSSSGLDERAKFHPKPLRSIQDCKQFARQKTDRIAKCDAYFKGFELFIDPGYRHRLRECALLMKTITEGSIPAIFYRIMAQTVFTKKHRLVMMALNSEVLNFLDLIPQVMYFLGPKGKQTDLAQGLTPLYSNMALSASETESLNLAYNQLFFDALNRTLILEKANVQYLVINGWHLRNMEKPPVLRSDFNQIYSGIVIWVGRSHAHLIGKNEVVKFLNGTFMPVIYDMPGSPDYNVASSFTPGLCLWVFVGMVVVVVSGGRDRQKE